MMTRCAQHAFNHGYYAGALEQVRLSRILLEDLGKGETFNGSLAVVVCRWFYRNVRRMAPLAFFDAEESPIAMIGRAQPEKDIEERARRPWGWFHGHGF